MREKKETTANIFVENFVCDEEQLFDLNKPTWNHSHNIYLYFFFSTGFDYFKRFFFLRNSIKHPKSEREKEIECDVC